MRKYTLLVTKEPSPSVVNHGEERSLSCFVAPIDPEDLRQRLHDDETTPSTSSNVEEARGIVTELMGLNRDGAATELFRRRREPAAIEHLDGFTRNNPDLSTRHEEEQTVRRYGGPVEKY